MAAVLAAVAGLSLPALPSAAAAPAGTGAGARHSGVVVATHAGKVRGSDAGHGTRRFLGIPFAQPPVGALRWRAPREVTPWRGVRPAHAPAGSECRSRPVTSTFRIALANIPYPATLSSRSRGPKRPSLEPPPNAPI